MTGKDRNDRDPVINEIRKHNPHALKCYLTDGTVRDVAIRQAGNKWAKLVDTLLALSWERIECVDKSGALLGVVENEEEYEEEEDDAGGGKLHKIVSMMKDVMKTTMKETRLMFDSQMKANSELLAAMVEAQRSVSDSYALAMRVQATNLTSGGEGQGSEVMDMMRMAMMMNSGRMPAPKPSPTPPPKPANPPQGSKPNG